MAQTLSTVVSNMTATPAVAVESSVVNGTLKILRDTVTVPDTANADTIILAPISVDAIIDSLEVVVADLGTTGTMDIGFFKENRAGGTLTFEAVDKDCIANNLAVTLAASSALAPQRFAGLAADAVDKKVWEIAGLSTRPSYSMMYIGLTTDTGTTTSGTVSIACAYTV